MILTIMGTRPQYVKCAVLRSAYKEAGINEVLLDTGQHYDSNMSTGIFKQLNVPEPDIKLTLGGQSQCTAIGSMIIELERIVNELNPKAVVVLGDTNSTLAGGLVAKRLGKPLLHIEAGLRSYDKTMPEEQNRIVIDHLSDQLFCPTQRAIKNLKSEGLEDGVHFTGDVMFDAVHKYRALFVRPDDISESSLKTDFDLVTLHRADALVSQDALQARINYIRECSLAKSKLFLVHPHTAKKLKEYNIDVDDFMCIGPQGYLETQWLLSRANHLFTDSGGMQKEAFFHNCKTTTLRNSTEWEETIESGLNSLWNSTKVRSENINKTQYPYGSGQAADIIASLILGVI
ncbi:non-hydrolyzing UDP-N-acetylglucosamine 2-epimerase [Neptuniibacter caesariensis]|uniref:UDP-n-acetylglucosamine 2-epimerase n=1 Tax=Neptuniibacter caesariensis TaxID=207954 RepID=A0A7U8GRM9_NEPCE|nr:UDP-N-acetylglucosamine 2-epimerase (non-hydrolyzing) [Neptuniibacter caesariensis]EAR60521.1 UDP-n-acetylglucosamine 2-epimerase [Oceanospirillum sp. MED92] [Neptuniibacter caesariensis]